MTAHDPIEPTAENGWASWQCRGCRTACASDNPCDCCSDDYYLEEDPAGA